MAATEVFDMVQLGNDAFQYLGVYNLNLYKTYDQGFNRLCLRRRFLALEGAFKKLPPSGVPTSELEVVDVQLNPLSDVSFRIVNHFSNASRSINIIRFTI